MEINFVDLKKFLVSLQIVTLAHYLLSDLYVTDDFLTPDLPANQESDSEDDRERVCAIVNCLCLLNEGI